MPRSGRQPTKVAYHAAWYDDGKMVLGPTKYIDPSRCPQSIMVGEHYRDNGDCLCSNAKHRTMMMREWEYIESDFVGVALID